MEERRFDALTRTLGAATSRRTLLKGALGGALALAVGRVVKPTAAAAAERCGSSSFEECVSDAWHEYSDQMRHCNSERVPGGTLGCALSAWFIRWQRIRACRTGRCGPELACCADHCVRLSEDQDNCGACGHTCKDCEQCSGGRCAPIHCDETFVCKHGECICPPDKHICIAPFGHKCCAANEACSGIFVADCTQKCKKCEIYDANTKTCKPKECDACQICDNDTGQCMPAADGTACGSNLACCGGQCQDASKRCGGGGDYGGCPACQQRNGDGVCVPKQDGAACGSCGQCSGGACTQDARRPCGECTACSANGNCMPVADNTPCGSDPDNNVCCNQTCTAGKECGPCPYGKNGHQCPANASGIQICCYDNKPCCASITSGATVCGATNGVCCTPNTQVRCGDVCCDIATETCGYYDNGTIGKCCPQGQTVVDGGDCCENDLVCSSGETDLCCASGTTCRSSSNGKVGCCSPDQGLMDDGTCCDGLQICSTATGEVCCASGMDCATDFNGNHACCEGSVWMDPKGNCCTADQYLAACVDGSAICCSNSVVRKVCCDGICQPGYSLVSDGSCCLNDQVCASDTAAVCCGAGQNCAGDDQEFVACCPDSTHVATDGTCCTADQFVVVCADLQSVCCSDANGQDACCSAHGGVA